MFNKFEKKPKVEEVKKIVVKPIEVKDFKTEPKEVVAGNPDEKVIDGKLYRAVGYMDNGCSKSKLVEVK